MTRTCVDDCVPHVIIEAASCETDRTYPCGWGELNVAGTMDECLLKRIGPDSCIDPARCACHGTCGYYNGFESLSVDISKQVGDSSELLSDWSVLRTAGMQPGGWFTGLSVAGGCGNSPGYWLRTSLRFRLINTYGEETPVEVVGDASFDCTPTYY